MNEDRQLSQYGMLEVEVNTKKGRMRPQALTIYVVLWKSSYSNWPTTPPEAAQNSRSAIIGKEDQV